jgi:hypothetical protein
MTAAKKVAKPEKPKGRPGQPTIYTDAIADKICARLANGESLVTICKDKDMPCRAAVQRWLQEDRHKGFIDKYARAHTEQADFYASQIIEIADEDIATVQRGEDSQEVVFDSTAVARNRLRVDARKWYASKLAPKKYGEKLALGQADDLLPLVTIKDLTGRKD